MYIQQLRNLISLKGSIPFDEFMSLALLNKEFGYYIKQNPFGRAGDFITSPELSQTFGEIIASFIATTWVNLNQPKTFHLIELGGGRGTLMQDIMRILNKVENLNVALKPHMVEVNEVLIKAQKEKLSSYNVNWLSNLQQFNEKDPIFILSNEFFDALAVKQYYKNENEQLFEAHIKEKNNELICEFLPCSNSYIEQIVPKNGFYETSSVAINILSSMLNLVERNKGAILTIDYGSKKPQFKNTIRGFLNHTLLEPLGILKHAPTCDITYNVNFAELHSLAQNHNVNNYEILTQGEFLIACGILQRVEKLAKLLPSKKEQETFLDAASKLISQQQMGEIFKAMAVSSKDLVLPVFSKI